MNNISNFMFAVMVRKIKFQVVALFMFSLLTFTSVFSKEHVEINLNVRNDIGNTSQYNFSFGISPTATDVLDKDLGELNLPPASPFGFYVAFEFIDSTQIEPDGSKFYDRIWTNKDLRYIPDNLKHYYVQHKMIFRFGQGKKILINWNNDNFPEMIDSIFLRDRLNGFVINYDMKKVNSMEWNNDEIRELLIHVYYDLTKTTVNEEIFQPLSIFPNPAKDVINFDSNIIYDRFELFDILGNVVLRSGYIQSLNISSLPIGVYTARVFVGNEVQIHKVVKN